MPDDYKNNSFFESGNRDGATFRRNGESLYNEMRGINLKRYTIAALLILVVGWSAVLPAGNRGDDLWQRAVAVAESNQDWVPGQLESHIKMLTRKGRVKDHIETWLKLEAGKDDQIVTSLLKYIKNGVDETEKRRERFLEARKKAQAERKKDRGERNNSNSLTIGLQDHPFAAAVQDAVSFQLLKSDVLLDGKSCSIFAYRQKLAGSGAVVRTGKVWIHQETGIPVQHEFTLEPLPSRVKRFTQRISYQSDRADTWYPRTLEIDGVGGFLFIRKYFKSRVLFTNYFQQKSSP